MSKKCQFLGVRPFFTLGGMQLTLACEVLE
jgi:hypothetical protein